MQEHNKDKEDTHSRARGHVVSRATFAQIATQVSTCIYVLSTVSKTYNARVKKAATARTSDSLLWAGPWQ